MKQASIEEIARAAFVKKQRLAARSSFEGWCEFVLRPRGQSPARHHRALIAALEKVCSGETKRLMVHMPPAHAKTTFSSVLFPAYFMMRHPRSALIMGSAGVKLAEKFSGQVQSLVADNAAVLGYRNTNDAKELWYTDNGCEYKAVGVGSSVRGLRSKLTLIDDPIGSEAEARSKPARDEVYEWFRADILGRGDDDTRIVIIMTRGHEDDLAARLIADGTEDWTVLNWPAIAEWEDELGRKPGDALWPEKFPLESLLKKKVSVGPRAWAAQYQQRPAPEGGALFPVEKIGVALADAPGRKVRSWDLAASEAIGSRDPDYTVGVKMGLDGSSVVIEDVARGRGGPQMVERMIVETAERDGKAVTILLQQDPGQAGKAQVAYLAAKLAGYTIKIGRPTGNKVTRAMPLASQMDAGNVLLRPGAWNRAFRDEYEVFPNGTHDDQVDAGADGYGWLIEGKSAKPARAVHVGLIGR